MQAAEVLGVPVDLINPQVVDTDSVGYTSGTGGSGVTHKTGWAAIEAANHVKKQLIERASKIWDISTEDIEMEKGSLRSISDQSLTMSLPEIAEQLLDTGGPVVGSSNIDPPVIGSAYAGCIVDVDVDPDTGKTTVERFTIVQDAGKAIHPSYVEGQMQGGSVQGIGWALNEEYYMNESGEMMNTSFLDYRIPVILDLPMIDTVIVEVPSPTHPYGVRGVGEVNLVPPPAAIANGIYRAQGVRMNKLPMNPAAVMEAVWNK
jgi:CO/xanthine dehydrogenase Mo-binding subunit